MSALSRLQICVLIILRKYVLKTNEISIIHDELINKAESDYVCIRILFCWLSFYLQPFGNRDFSLKKGLMISVCH